jgi:hypothetical protein
VLLGLVPGALGVQRGPLGLAPAVVGVQLARQGSCMRRARSSISCTGLSSGGRKSRMGCGRSGGSGWRSRAGSPESRIRRWRPRSGRSRSCRAKSPPFSRAHGNADFHFLEAPCRAVVTPHTRQARLASSPETTAALSTPRGLPSQERQACPRPKAEPKNLRMKPPLCRRSRLASHVVLVS